MRVGLKQCTKYDVVTLTVLYRYLYITAIFQTVLTQNAECTRTDLSNLKRFDTYLEISRSVYVVTDDDDKLVNLILFSKHHVLHSILPDRSDFNYNLRPRRHNLVLTAKSSSITDRDYMTRMLFKNIY